MSATQRACRLVGFAGRLVGRASALVAHATRDVLSSRARLVAENVALRAQLGMLKRQVRRAAPDPADRVLLVSALRLVADPDAVLHAVRPETLLRWHRDLDRWLWAWRSRPRRRTAPRRTPDTVRQLVVDMASANPRWGSLRITGELARNGLLVSRRTVQRILSREWPRGRPRAGQSWRTFLANHAAGTWACDFFTLTTLGFKRLHVLYFVRLDAREVVHANVTAHPTAAWTVQQLRNACWDESPRLLIRDRDARFSAAFDEVVEGDGGRVLVTPYRTPVANAVAERLVGTLRRELFDHVIPRDEDHARSLLLAYLRHYREARAHQGLDQRTPGQVRSETTPPTIPLDRRLSVDVRPVLNGLVQEFWLRAA